MSMTSESSRGAVLQTFGGGAGLLLLASCSHMLGGCADWTGQHSTDSVRATNTVSSEWPSFDLKVKVIECLECLVAWTCLS